MTKIKELPKVTRPREIFLINDSNKISDYVAEGVQANLFDLLEEPRPPYKVNTIGISSKNIKIIPKKNGYFSLHNRRYLGNKYKLLGFIEDIIHEKCAPIQTFFDIFAGTGVVGERLNNGKVKIIANDFMQANYHCIKSFLATNYNIENNIVDKIQHLNDLSSQEENYFSINFGDTYFTKENAIKIGAIREEIELISENEYEKSILICSLIYAVDKVANTVGHYDAFRKTLDSLNPLKLLIPDIKYSCNSNNEIYKEDANTLVQNITCDVLYIDPPYNSRQYSDAYHLLENLAEWKKPTLVGIGKKMDRSHIKSSYCLKDATHAFSELIKNANCRHILLSYNNTGNSKDGRSNARISDEDILSILNNKGDVEVFERKYKAFTTGKSKGTGNSERIFSCKVIN